MPDSAIASPAHVAGLFYLVFVAATAFAEHRMNNHPPMPPLWNPRDPMLAVALLLIGIALLGLLFSGC